MLDLAQYRVDKGEVIHKPEAPISGTSQNIVEAMKFMCAKLPIPEEGDTGSSELLGKYFQDSEDVLECFHGFDNNSEELTQQSILETLQKFYKGGESTQDIYDELIITREDTLGRKYLSLNLDTQSEWKDRIHAILSETHFDFRIAFIEQMLAMKFTEKEKAVFQELQDITSVNHPDFFSKELYTRCFSLSQSRAAIVAYYLYIEHFTDFKGDISDIVDPGSIPRIDVLQPMQKETMTRLWFDTNTRNNATLWEFYALLDALQSDLKTFDSLDVFEVQIIRSYIAEKPVEEKLKLLDELGIEISSQMQKLIRVHPIYTKETSRQVRSIFWGFMRIASIGKNTLTKMKEQVQISDSNYVLLESLGIFDNERQIASSSDLLDEVLSEDSIYRYRNIPDILEGDMSLSEALYLEVALWIEEKTPLEKMIFAESVLGRWFSSDEFSALYPYLGSSIWDREVIISKIYDSCEDLPQGFLEKIHLLGILLPESV